PTVKIFLTLLMTILSLLLVWFDPSARRMRAGRGMLPSDLFVARALSLRALFQFIRRKLGETANEGDERPRGLRVVLVSPSRHAREAHSVGDDVEQLSISQLLRFSVGQVRNLRIHVAPNQSITAAVNAVTD